MATTFVTAYLKIYDEDYDSIKTFDNRLKHFISLLDLGINISIIIDPVVQDTFNDLQLKYDNLKIIQIMKIEDLELYKLGNNYSEFQRLPTNLNLKKDTKNYMFLMLSKIEFIKKAMDVNPYDSDYFCWIDFSLPYVFKDKNNSLLKMKNISNRKLCNRFICFPGCWNFKVNDIHFLKHNIVWRFCGGIFIGDKDSLNDFYIISRENFLNFLNETKTLVWEVNYWAWLESNGLISPIWYYAAHDDTIIDLPNTLFDLS